jgi:ectoine hydroxylase-related dioxygenase (phytanoyl-CoA dioxygenase family)
MSPDAKLHGLAFTPGGFAMSAEQFTAEELSIYQRDGFFIARGLFAADEIQKIRTFAEADPMFANSVYGRRDATGRETKIALWNHAGDDLYSMCARSPRVVDRMEQMLTGEVYLYHMKMNYKEPFVGGAWEWHQDYGYWYNNGCLLPLMASCLIAVSPANRENGCLQVIRGSHAIGRIEHGKTGDQAGADLERVNVALERMELVYAECEPGDAIFFDGNLLHRSDANLSAHPRWSLICCYNAARNNPYKESKHPRYSPLAKVTASAVRDWQPTTVG